MQELIYKNKGYRGLIGVAEIEITAPVGIYARNWGAATHDISTGNDHFLKAVCVSFQQREEDKPMLLISADLGVWRSPEVRDQVLQYLCTRFNIPDTHLVLCFTHTHAGPVLSPEESNKQGGELIAPYIRFLKKQFISVIKKSLAAVSPSIITWHYGTCHLATNRDLFVADEQRFLTGFNPEKDADKTLLVGRIFDLQKKEGSGTIVNYACHPTTLAWQNSLISADYVGEMRRTVSSYAKGPVLYVQGASGDLAPRQQYTADMAVVQKNGRQLGFAVLATLEDMLPVEDELFLKEMVPSGADLAHWCLRRTKQNTQLSAYKISIAYPLKSIPTRTEIEGQYERETDRLIKEKLWRQRNIRLQFGDTSEAQVPLWLWQIGDAVLVAQQNETYSIFQQKLRAEFPQFCIGVANIANGSAGYLPPEALYTEDCYAVKQTPFARGSLELLLDKSLETIKKLFT